MTDNGSERARKAFKTVEKAAHEARNKVARAMRDAQAESRREQNYALAREAKRLKREKHYSNGRIADEMDMSESSVRALLLMKIQRKTIIWKTSSSLLQTTIDT